MVKKSAPLDLPSFAQSAAQEAAASTPQAASVSYPVTKASSSTQTSSQAALPLFPKAKRPSFSSHRNDANAALALNLLADVESAIVEWHQALRETLLKIQQLYLAGPIIDGWLEAVHPQNAQQDLQEQAAVLRHGDPAQIAAYVEKLSQQPQPNSASTGTQYRLCSLDADGQVIAQTCPPEQLGAVSQAIARNQQLRQLLNQKQYLEARLKRAAEALDMTRQALDIREETKASPE